MNEDAKRTIEPIAYIRTDFKEKFGIPRQSGRVESIAEVIMLPPYDDPRALTGIEEFSHLWLIFDFSESHREEWSPTVRPPRLGGNKRIGVFASRSPFRPNSLGLSAVKLIKVNTSGKLSLTVSGADLLDMTPIYDIKPYLPRADIRRDATGGYSDKEWDHRLDVIFPEELRENIDRETVNAVTESIADDPRPSYHSDPDRIYSMRFKDMDIHFTICENTAKITGIDKI